MRNQRWPWLASVIAGTILFALDLPYILLACHAGFCNSYPFDPLILAFIVIKGIVAGSLLGWMSVAVYEAVPRTFLVGVLAICLEGGASAGLVYLQFLYGGAQAP